ncbi:MAG: nicotinamide-nucleotide amidohydrolase family protein [Pseudomonadota bacterium]
MIEYQQLAADLVRLLTSQKRTLATAESCTGGWIAKAITDVAGSSACFGYGIVSYSDDAKRHLLNVSAETLKQHGAVSEAVVREMAEGALRLSDGDLAVAVSGIAGPEGGSPGKPVGTVWFGFSLKSPLGPQTDAERLCFAGDRDAVRRKTLGHALKGAMERLAA